MNQYGLDIQEKLEKILSEELAKSIDAAILKSLQSLERTRVDSIRKVLEKIRAKK